MFCTAPVYNHKNHIGPYKTGHPGTCDHQSHCSSTLPSTIQCQHNHKANIWCKLCPAYKDNIFPQYIHSVNLWGNRKVYDTVTKQDRWQLRQ